MFSTKCQVQNDRTKLEKISCFCQNLQFRMYFSIGTSVFQLRPLLRFLCLINSFYRRYVSSMYNRSNRSNRSNLSEQQQLKKIFLKEFLSVAGAWFSWSGKQGGGVFFNCLQRLLPWNVMFADTRIWPDGPCGHIALSNLDRVQLDLSFQWLA